MPKNHQKLITAATVAEILGRDQRTVQRQAASGVLPFVSKLPGATGAYLFDRDVIEELQSTLSSDETASPHAAHDAASPHADVVSGEGVPVSSDAA